MTVIRMTLCKNVKRLGFDVWRKAKSAEPSEKSDDGLGLGNEGQEELEVANCDLMSWLG